MQRSHKDNPKALAIAGHPASWVKTPADELASFGLQIAPCRAARPHWQAKQIAKIYPTLRFAPRYTL